MKLDTKCVLKKSRINIFSSKGSSYIEISFCILAMSLIIYTFVQFYFLVHAQILMMNTAKVTLRNVEVNGGVAYQSSLEDGIYGGYDPNVTNNLSTNSNIDKNSIICTINGVDIRSIAPNTWIQMRESITVELKAKYNIMSGVALGPNFSVPLSVRYVGSSQRLHKDAGDFVPITK